MFLAADSENHIYENLINYARGGKDAVGRGASGKSAGGRPPAKERVQSTPRDADRYLAGLREKGVLGKKLQTKDGYDYFDVTQKCEYKGVKLRRLLSIRIFDSYTIKQN
jgi:hypothetical protein